jgi:hypothetical protein
MPHGVRSHRSSQDNLTRTSIQGTLAGRNRAGHTSRRTNSHRSHQDHSRSDLASRDALAGCKPRRPHLTENQLPSIPPGSFPLGPCVQGCTRWLQTAQATPHGEPTPVDPTRIFPARTLRPGMHSLAAAAPATPHGDPTPIDPKRIIPARTSCPRVPLACGKLPRLSLAMAPSHQGTGYPGMALVCRTIATEHSPLFSPRQAFLLFQGLITQQSTTLLKTPAPPLTQTPCLHDHGTHSAATTPSHRPPTHPGTHCV